MVDVLISLIIPSVIWLIVWLIYLSIKRIEKNATEMTVGTVVGSRLISGDEKPYRIPIIEYEINGKKYKKAIHVNQLIYFYKIPIGQKTCPPIHTQVELMYNPKKTYQIYAKIDNQFNKRFAMFILSVFAIFASIFSILLFLQEIGVSFL